MISLRDIRRRLPHDTHRRYMQMRWPERMAQFEAMREAAPKRDGYSLRPFLETRSIFVHVPKCAGISVTDALYGCHAGGHLTVADYRLAFDRREYRDFFKFTFVRNPWDRLVSAYYFLREGGMNERDQKDAEKSVAKFDSFEAFVLGFLPNEDLTKFYHLAPQTHYLCNTAHQGVDVDFVGRFETLQQDFRRIVDRLGMDATLEEKNRGNLRPASYRENFTPRSQEVVAEVYARDISLLGYEF